MIRWFLEQVVVLVKLVISRTYSIHILVASDYPTLPFIILCACQAAQGSIFSAATQDVSHM